MPAARRFGMPMKDITLCIFGGAAEMGDEPPSAKAEFLIALAGPPLERPSCRGLLWNLCPRRRCRVGVLKDLLRFLPLKVEMDVWSPPSCTP